MRAEPKQLGANERSGSAEGERVIAVFVCPDPKCGNYYGSSSMGNLAKQWNLTGIRTHSRARCPQCGTERVLRYARLITPDEVTEIRNQLGMDARLPGGPRAMP